VERRLKLFKTGEDALKVDDKADDEKGLGCAHNGFTEVPWGGNAHEFVVTVKKLEEHHWTSIYKGAAVYMQSTVQNVDEDIFHDNDLDAGSTHSRAFIQIDW